MNNLLDNKIYKGSRGSDFKDLIRMVLQKGKIKQKYIDELLSETNLKIYSIIFTDKTADPINNYEYYETLGDSTANNCIVWYLSRRFPQIFCAKCVKILARLKINYVSKTTFSSIAQTLNFWKFITASENERSTKMKPLLENVFEGFFGATQLILDNKFGIGTGYAICYNIIKNIYDDIQISLRYEDLFDAKTRLKELFDSEKIKSSLGPLIYETVKTPENMNETVVKAGTLIIGKGVSALKTNSEQIASENALKYLANTKGIFKSVPEEYKTFCI
jgi:dsRNA-specific ribonuclease